MAPSPFAHGVPKGTSKAQDQIWFYTHNVCGARVAWREGLAETPEAREAMRSEPTQKLAEIIRSVKGAAHIAVLADTHLEGEEMDEVIGHFGKAGFEAARTPGEFDTGTGRVTKGVMIVWDPKRIRVEREDRKREGETRLRPKVIEVEPGRVVGVRVTVESTGEELTVMGVYMPVRGGADGEEVRRVWDLLDDAVALEARVVVGGDLNAEPREWREKRGVEAKDGVHQSGGV